MKRLFITALIFSVFAGIAEARQRTIEQIRAAAATVIVQPAAAKGNGMAYGTGAMEVLRENSQLTIIGFRNNGGYAVIANDDVFKPVLGYSDTPLPEVLPPGLEWWLETMEKSLETLLAEGREAPDVKMNAGYKESVGPLVTTRWDQSEPYNNLCPTYTANGSTRHYVVGCVATSMAQVMNYHKWPEKGDGSLSWFFYPEGGGSRIRISANFGATAYDWENMRDTYTRNSYSTAEADAVSTLMYHCGVAVKMNYAQSGSGAYSYNACLALREYFRYNKNIKVLYRKYTHADEWMNRIYRELNDGCPIIYGGVSKSGGHSFVFDGYNSSGMVHVNWGWSGSGDGYFDIASLNGYTDGQDMLIVRPETDTRFTDGYRSIWVIGHSLTINSTIGGNLSVTTKGLFNFDVDNFSGMRGVLAKNLATDETTELYTEATTYTHTEENGARVFYARDWTNKQVNTALLADGTYRIYIATKDDRDTEWQPVRSSETVNNSYIFTKNGSSATVSEENNSGWVTSIGGINAETGADGIIRVYNLSGHLVYAAKSADFDIETVPAKGVLIVKNGSMIKKIVK